MIYESEISKYIPRHQTMLKRYAVLNNRALLFYKDEVAYQAYSNKPTVVIPLAEVLHFAIREHPI